MRLNGPHVLFNALRTRVFANALAIALFITNIPFVMHGYGELRRTTGRQRNA